MSTDIDVTLALTAAQADLLIELFSEVVNDIEKDAARTPEYTLDPWGSDVVAIYEALTGFQVELGTVAS